MEQKEILLEILKWERLKGIQSLQAVIPNLLDTSEKKLIYEMTDGSVGIKDIQKKLKVSSGKVSMLWSTWYANGLLEKDGQKYKRIISLKELGINLTK